MQLFDVLPLFDARRTSEGYLVSEVRAARTGIQQYSGFELGDNSRKTVRVYRPPEEVFKDEAMATFTSLPVTLDHPPEMVNAKNWKKYAVGFTGEGVARDGGFIRVPLALKDADAISRVEKGTRELSFGYTCNLEWKDGVTPEGEKYDAIQRDIRGNHLAIVSAGRAGSDCIVDHNDDGGHSMPGENLRTVLVDGIPVPATDASATVINTLEGRITADRTAHGLALSAKDTAIAAKDAVIADKDKELGTQAAKIADLEKKLADATLDAAKLDTLVTERAEAVGSAKLIAGDSLDFKGKTVPEIRRMAVAKVQGDAAVKDRQDVYVEAMFDGLVGNAVKSQGNGQTKDAVLSAIAQGGGTQHVSDANTAFQKLIQDKQDAWKTPHFNATKQ